MKVTNLRKQIINNLTISGVLLLVLGGIIYYNVNRNKISFNKAEEIQSETAQIKSRSIELQNKVIEAKKYQEAWKILTPNQKIINNIKMDEVNSKLNTIANKYSIIKPAIKVILPEDLHEGIFRRSSVLVAVSTTNLTFEAANDVRAISFLTEFLNSLQGYAILTNLEIKKSRQYSSQDLIQLSVGKGNGAVSVKADFYWYIYKPKLALSEEKQPKNDAIQNAE